MVEKRPADVVAYYRDQLDSRVAGVISMIRVAPGAVVKKDEKLIEIYVPELQARVKEQKANVDLTAAQVKQKEAAVEVATQLRNAVQARIGALQAKLRSDEGFYAYRQKQAKRYAGLLADRAIDDKLVDEQEDRLVASRETVFSTREAITAAEADVKAAAAKIDQANADLNEVKEKKHVMEAELEHAKAMLDFATIKAPFDGVIVKRNLHANVGATVQKADTGRPEPLLIIERQDIVTVVMRVPDNYATYITPDTEAIFETPSLPGVKIHGKVTRYPTSLVNPEHDRTMVVEIDLWNDSRAKFLKIKDNEEFKDSLKSGLPGHSNLPIVPQVEGKPSGGQRPRLLPGMFGQVTLVLRKFEDAYMLPSSAIDIVGGNEYIYVVQDGKAHHQPVKRQVDDGKLVKVELLNENGEVLGDLTGKEEVIVSNLGELSEGQAVKPVLVEDWKALAPGSEKKEKH